MGVLLFGEGLLGEWKLSWVFSLGSVGWGRDNAPGELQSPYKVYTSISAIFVVSNFLLNILCKHRV